MVHEGFEVLSLSPSRCQRQGLDQPHARDSGYWTECRAAPSFGPISTEARLASTTSSDSPIPSRCSTTCSCTRTTGAGRLLDLACGTGQITFGLASNFVESLGSRSRTRGNRVRSCESAKARCRQRSLDRGARRGRRRRRLLRARGHRERVSPLAATSDRRVSDALARSGRAPCASVEQLALGRKPTVATSASGHRERLDAKGGDDRQSSGEPRPALGGGTAYEDPRERWTHDRARVRSRGPV